MPEHINELINSNDIEFSRDLSKKVLLAFKRLDLWFGGAHNLIVDISDYNLIISPKKAGGEIGVVCPNYYHNTCGDFNRFEVRKKIGMDPKSLAKVKVLEIDQKEGVSSYKIPTENGEKVLYIYYSRQDSKLRA